MALGPPIIDFCPFFTDDNTARATLVTQIREACQEFGFFQLQNHGIPEQLQAEVLRQCEKFFTLPIETKKRYNKDDGGFNRGYECLRAQNFEKSAEGDLKEGFYLGQDLPLDDPYVQAHKFSQGPNKYPEEVEDPGLFRRTVDQYHDALSTLARNILSVMAETLGLERTFFDEFCHHPVAILRLLHYPPQAPDASELERGIGAHMDFGAITILLQDSIGGLQVWNRSSKEWVDIQPTPGAVVVNTGNMMMRWTNDRYISNLHRVINKTGNERYSVPFFFSGNPDYLLQCLETCKSPGEQAKYPPITVGEWMTGRYADTYGTSKGKAVQDLVCV
ncbi:hypothetical protein FE257_003566 [Aspergillus nanangensis]|uniref:Fe2OG dioxygenase domain-containing protein n=1 Tax=Aspergillus nanangensis TaxID=2582783 RepID=A0AAD4CBD9_ASPNN|nr:hypothetical protein FE257_003566 [Aspergillus nanangensis]